MQRVQAAQGGGNLRAFEHFGDGQVEGRADAAAKDAQAAGRDARDAKANAEKALAKATTVEGAASDLGGADWERDLINACRERHFLWRTEETYRMWGNRFARSLSPRSSRGGICSG